MQTRHRAHTQSLIFAIVAGALSPAGAFCGEVSPAADTVGMTTLDLQSGKVTHCDFNKPRSAAERAKTTKNVSVAFVKLAIDMCVWGDARPGPSNDTWALYRNGADVGCLIETSAATAASDPGPGAYLEYVRSKGMTDARSLADETTKIDGRSWHHEVVQSTLAAQPPATKGSLHRSAIWAWYGRDKVATLTCFGPTAAVQENMTEIQAVASTLSIHSE